MKRAGLRCLRSENVEVGLRAKSNKKQKECQCLLRVRAEKFSLQPAGYFVELSPPVALQSKIMLTILFCFHYQGSCKPIRDAFMPVPAETYRRVDVEHGVEN
jgi:hypothetical protein